jgi:hypothetical protein
MVPVTSKWTMANGQCRELNAIYNQQQAATPKSEYQNLGL